MIKAKKKTLVQCDFDGTITEEDVSFLILDAFGRKDWRKLFKDYQDAKMTVGRFNADAFVSVKADKQKILKLVKEKAKVRPGFPELVDSCRRTGFRFVIVSNGLRFYIEDILRRAGIEGIEVYAAETEFNTDGLKVFHLGPGGMVVDDDVKLVYANSFLAQGYRIIYIGDGTSDFLPARKSQYVFACAATGSLLKQCRTANVDCTPFTDLREVARHIESL